MLTYAPNSFMGINYNSPTIQNMIPNQPIGIYQQQLPYSTTPNIGNIGSIGYNSSPNNNPYIDYMNNPYYNQMMNGGYYSGYYNYNPQEIRRQIEEQQKAEEARIQNEISIQKLKAQIYGTFNNVEIDEDYIEEMYNPNTYVEINKDLNDYEEMRRLSEISNDPNRILGPNIMAMNNIANISQQIRSNHLVDQSFSDFLQTAGDLYRDALINENARLLRQNIANTYDRDAYNQLTSMHRQSSFASLRQNTSLEDLSISLPDNLKRSNEYQARKNEFLNFIVQNDARNQGGF